MVLAKNENVNVNADISLTARPRDHFDHKLACLLLISVFVPSFSLYPFCLCFPAALLTAVYILAGKERRAALFRDPVSLRLPILWGILLISPLMNGNYYGILCGFLFDLYLLIALWLRSIMTVDLVGKLCDIACAASIVCALEAVAQYFIAGPDRESSFFWNANFYAFVIELVIILAFYRFYSAGRGRWLYLAVVALNIGALLLTGCRSAWIAMFVGLLCLFAMTRQWRAMIILGLFAAVSAYLICRFPAIFPRVYQMQMASQTRFRIWHGAFMDFLAHPMFGQGLLAFYHVSHDPITPHAHSILFDTLECTGIGGLSLLIAYAAPSVAKIARTFKKMLPEQKACAGLVAGLVISTLIHGITDIPYMGVQTGLFFTMLLTFREPAVREPAKI